MKFSADIRRDVACTVGRIYTKVGLSKSPPCNYCCPSRSPSPFTVVDIMAEQPQQPQIQIQVPPGAPQPTPEQIAQIQRQITQEAAKAGISIQEYVERLRAEAMRQQQMHMQQQAQQGQHAHGPGGHSHGSGQGQHQHPHPPQQQQAPPPQATQIPLNGAAGPPKPEAIAIANFLKSQELKPRISLFNNERKEMFRVKRAIRALESPAYQKARTKNALLPEVKDRTTAENVFKMLPMSLLALRVTKIDPHEGHNHGPKKRIKGQWTVRVEQHQVRHERCRLRIAEH